MYNIMLRRKETETSHVKETVRKINVCGYEDFRKAIKELYQNENTQVNILFTGQKNAQGVSWCPDCVNAEPFIQKALADYAKKDSIFLEVDVGDRETYKNKENPFRQDKDIKIQEIPTLLRWNTVFRLEGDFCAKPNLLEMFFSEKDEED